jgi:predicted alpha-1,2-mannosidase
MRYILSAFLVFFQLHGNTQQKFDPVEMVNPLMGTDSKYSLSNGNTYPAVCVPWGMNFWTPQTNKMGNGWQYQYSADKINGFKQTHQPSPWMNDYGQFAIMPVRGIKFRQDDRASWFSHKTEIAKPYYYSVYLADADVTAELTPTERAAQFRFTFPKTDSAFIVVDAFDRGSYIKIIPEQNKVIGYSTRYSRGKLPGFRNYFVMQFSKPFTNAYTWRDSTLKKDSLELTADHTGAIVGFNTAKGEKLQVKVASSFISFEQAELNLSNELQHDSFETTKTKAKNEWNKKLGQVMVEGGTEEQIRTFYSCLYRMVQFPQRLYEIDATGSPVHYSPYDGKVYKGYMFGGTGFWDTFRALYPFLNLLYPSINQEMQESLANAYKEGGWLPEWSSPGYANIMIGNNSASVVADAYIKGVKAPSIDTLYTALLKGANNEGPMDAVARKGARYYTTLGYVPADANINESAARTLEYAYDDFAIYQLAKKLNRSKEEIALYERRSQNYRNLFSKEYNLMRGKNKDGSFQTPFNPFKWGDAFTEGNSWHYSWSVFHDIAGLKQLMGGDKMFVEMLDSVFNMPPVYDESYYKGVIHEIREMQITNMGQYAHGNQPIQHMIYLYNYTSQPWKSQYWLREVMNKLYKPTPDGYCGDEDNGQTSAWYVFTAMGFYPVCPAIDQYVLGTPLFKKVTLKLENGKQFIITAPSNSAENKYLQKVSLNEKSWSNNWIDHDDIMKGGKLDFNMSAMPNKQRGITSTAFPYSYSSYK